MSSDQIQPERAYIPRSKQSLSGISGRAWVKRDLEFWHRCTVERYSNASVTVSLDDLDELTVEPEQVAQFELEPGDLVFFRPPFWQGSLSGYPGFVNAVNRETVELDFPSAIYGTQGMRITSLLREIRVYCELPPIEWKNGSQVFAWKAVPFNYIYKSVELKPERFLMFPGRVQGTHYDVCVEVEFGDGETSWVPTTLVERLEANPGDMVYACTSYVSHGTNPDECWSPCRIVTRDGDNLLLQDGTGDRFESNTSMIAILPKGYRMFDGKFERITEGSERDRGPSTLNPPASANVHIVRTERWENAGDDPITKPQVDALVASDPELDWSGQEWHGMSGEDDEAFRHFSILWKGRKGFRWCRNEIRCATPNEEQLAKMIEMAIELDANVLGDDGEEYH